MNYENMSTLIFQLRKSKNMTQKELADQLHVTDKAVSKWERGLGYPDIKILPELARLLGVTTNELLSGKENETPQPIEEQIVRNTLHYANKAVENKNDSILKTVFTILSGMFLIAILVCVICDVAVTKSISWSLYVISSVVYTWFIIAPIFSFKKYRFVISVFCMSVLTIPFLFVIERVSNTSGWLAAIAIPSTLIALVYLWAVCCMFTFTKINRWILSSMAFALVIVFEFIINAVVDHALSQSGPDVWDFFAAICTAVIAASLFLFGVHSKKRNGIHH